MDESAVLETLGRAVELQFRSPLQFALVAGTAEGFEYQALVALLSGFAVAELDDTRRLVEKLVAIGGRPGTAVAPLAAASAGDTKAAVGRLIETECTVIEALHSVIAHTGQEGRSEALEHLIEHVIMRKQEQVDTLQRALGRA